MKALSMHILVVLSIVVAFIWPNSPWLVGNLRFEQNSMLFGYPWGSATWPPSMSSLFCRGGCQGGSSQISWWIPSTAVVGYLPPQPDHNFFGPPVNILEHVRETGTRVYLYLNFDVFDPNPTLSKLCVLFLRLLI